MNSSIVSVRLGAAAWRRYSAEAEARRIGLATYIRQRLEEQERVVAELTLRATTEQAAAASEQPKQAPPPTDSGTLVEVLLLLRSLAGPQRSAIAQAEIERRGLVPWR